MKRKRSSEAGSDFPEGVKINVAQEGQLKTKFFEKEGKIVLPKDFEDEMESHHQCGSDQEEISKINESDSRYLATLIAADENIHSSQVKRELINSFC